jgi:hypothetical protein
MQRNSTFSPPSFSDLLPEELLHCIPTIHRNETLYSWCARYHRISGSIAATTTSQRLFGSKTAGFVVDFPGRIRHFSTVTASILGAPDLLIRNHTLYSLYAAFRPQSTMATIEGLMLGNSVERVKFLLGLPASRAATSHPLKFCPTCVHDESNEHGVARWWRDHQWPSVWMCSGHQTVLHYLPRSKAVPKVSSWLTPDCLPHSAAICAPELSGDALPGLERLTSLTLSIVQRSIFLRPEIMRILFTLKLREYGWIKSGGMIDWPALQDAFVIRFGHLKALPGFDFIQGIRSDDFGSLSLILRGSQRRQHPTKYILLIDILFDTAEQFFDLYRQFDSIENPDAYTKSIKRIDTDQADGQLRSLVIDNGLSLNKAAGTLGISVQHAIDWAKKNNLTYQKRPRKTNSALQSNIDRLLKEGASRAAISKALNVSRKWITSYLARHPDQRQKWIEVNHTNEISNRRSQLLALLAAHPAASQKEIRSIPGNPFQWLKRNDLDWLKKNLPFFDIKIRP